jgi:hypothetical protein
MTAGWVAATTRGRAFQDRLVGPGGARSLATARTWPDARSELAITSYGAELPLDADRATARRVAAAATAWQLRVLAGWLPPAAVGLARLFAAPIEIANIEAHVARLGLERSRGGRAGGVPAPESITLGSLALAWPRVATAASAEQVREALARTAWGDPGGSDLSMMAFGLRVGWVRRLTRSLPTAVEWAHGALAALIARERFVFDREITVVTAREIDRLVGDRWRRASSVTDLAAQLPESAGWAIAGVETPSDLWRSEVAVIGRVASDARRQATSNRYGRTTVAAIMALLLVDLWRVTAAIEAAGRGPAASEVLDAVA